MNKAELVSYIAEHAEVAKAQAEAVLGALDSGASCVLLEGGEVTLPGLGKLKAVQKPARTGRNPQTGEAVQIAAKTAVKFVPSKALKDYLN